MNKAKAAAEVGKNLLALVILHFSAQTHIRPSQAVSHLYLMFKSIKFNFTFHYKVWYPSISPLTAVYIFFKWFCAAASFDFSEKKGPFLSLVQRILQNETAFSDVTFLLCTMAMRALALL